MNNLIVDSNSQIFNKTNTGIYIDEAIRTHIYAGSSGSKEQIYYPKNSEHGSIRNNKEFNKKYGIEEFKNIQKNTKRIYLNEISNENISVFANGLILPNYTKDNDYIPTFYRSTDNYFFVNLDFKPEQDIQTPMDIMILNQSAMIKFEKHADLNQNIFDVSGSGNFNDKSILFVDGKFVPREIAGIINWTITNNTLTILNINSSRKNVILIGNLMSEVFNGFNISKSEEVELAPGMDHSNTVIFINEKPRKFNSWEIDSSTGIGKVKLIPENQKITSVCVCKTIDYQSYDMYPSISVVDFEHVVVDNHNTEFKNKTLVQKRISDDGIVQSTKLLNRFESSIGITMPLNLYIQGSDYYYVDAISNQDGVLILDENGNKINDIINSNKVATIETEGQYVLIGKGIPIIANAGSEIFIDKNTVTIMKNATRVNKIIDYNHNSIDVNYSNKLVSATINGKISNDYCEVVNGSIIVSKEILKPRGNIVSFIFADPITKDDCIIISYFGHEYLNLKNIDSYKKIINIISVSDSPSVEYIDVSPLRSMNLNNRIRASNGGVVSIQTYNSDSSKIFGLEFENGRVIFLNADGRYRAFCACSSVYASGSLEIENNNYSYNIEYSNATEWRDI